MLYPLSYEGDAPIIRFRRALFKPRIAVALFSDDRVRYGSSRGSRNDPPR